jgi:hypothetical protein
MPANLNDLFGEQRALILRSSPQQSSAVLSSPQQASASLSKERSRYG